MSQSSKPPTHGTADAVALVKEPAALPKLTNEEFRTITESAIDGIVVMDGHGRVTHWNPAAEKVFGWTAEEIVGKSLHDTLTPPEFREAAYKGIARFLESGQGPLLGSVRTVTGMRKDGSYFPLELSLSVFEVDDKWWAAAFTRDVTERHEAEQEMRNYASALEEVNQKLRAMREKAEAATESKSRFLANMSHEIRTPLNGIMGFTSLLLDTDLNNEQFDYTDTIYRSGELLLQTINNILDFSKIEAGQLQLEEVDFDLQSIMKNLVSLLSIKSNEKKIKLMVDFDEEVPPLLRGDPLRISQILLNLMSNAVKFTDRGKVVVDIHADHVTQQKIDLEICVSDSGIGIPADRIDSLFQPFMQVDSSVTRKFGGTGLGLTICHHLAKLMDGKIKVHSPAISSKCVNQGGPGATFVVTLPLLRQTLMEGQEPLELPKIQASQFDRRLWKREKITARALVAEDNPVNQKLLSQMLKKFGLEVTAVENGQEAIDLLKNEAFDIIMMDFEMPQLNGIEATRLIRDGETSVEASVPIVILTAHAMKEDRGICLSTGANEYLTKPFHPDVIYQTVSKLLSQGASSGERRTYMKSEPKTIFDSAQVTPQETTQEAFVSKMSQAEEDEKPAAYDAKELLIQCGHDQDLMDDLIRIFIESHEAMLAEIAKAIRQGAPESIAKAAHKVKGSLNALYAAEATQAAVALEKAANENQGEETIQRQFDVLQENVQELVRQMRPKETVG